MFQMILSAAGLVRSTYVKPTLIRIPVRRARWRGRDGRWQWQAV
ncbi:MAG TPA: hypothetical protein VFK86_10700 [Bauldia sp.]|nr:hypothetical protein [Bauldia sp.]